VTSSIRHPPNTPRFTIEAIDFLERPVRFRLPLRCGAATLAEAPQAFARATIRLAGAKHLAMGAAAEMMIPKCLDKDPVLSDRGNIDQLRRSLLLARDAYLADRKPATAYEHHVRHYRNGLAARVETGLVPLAASYGPALVDRALLDALARALGVSFHGLMRANGVGFDPALLAPEFAGFDADAFLRARQPLSAVAARHTIGLAEPLSESDPAGGDPRDGLPRSLAAIIAAYGHRYFKIEIGGDSQADRKRLVRIAAILDALPDYRVTLDANEQFEDAAAVEEFWRGIAAEPALARLCASTLFVEQPIARDRTFEVPAPALGVPVLIDEADGDLDAFPAAKALGYRGVSSKSCKGMYKSLANLARVERWNRETQADRYFLSAEDLTLQAGIAVQQDLALVALLGIPHVERNGHHHVDGMAGLSANEQQAFLDGHPDLYVNAHGATRGRIARGMLEIGSLDCVGFASRAMPDWDSMTIL
jgi:hypothetical protein